MRVPSLMDAAKVRNASSAWSHKNLRLYAKNGGIRANLTSQLGVLADLAQSGIRTTCISAPLLSREESPCNDPPLIPGATEVH